VQGRRKQKFSNFFVFRVNKPIWLDIYRVEGQISQEVPLRERREELGG